MNLEDLTDGSTISKHQWDDFDKKNGNWEYTNIAYAYEYHPDYEKGEAIAILTESIRYHQPCKSFPYGRAEQIYNGKRKKIYINLNSFNRRLLLLL